jgi:hypothetical protein
MAPDKFMECSFDYRTTVARPFHASIIPRLFFKFKYFANFIDKNYLFDSVANS